MSHRKKLTFSVLTLLFILNSVKGEEKSSLTFVIDDTGSMSNDIKAVKNSVYDIFDAVENSNASQIEDFVLVTFNDPTFKHRNTTRNRDQFKNAVAAIHVDGGDDCPEMAMSGIELALQKSRPGSLLYVYTDAGAKDYEKHEIVKTLAQRKNIQVTFVLTGKCSSGYGEAVSEVYYEVAKETAGQVFNVHKTEVSKIMKYVENQIKSRQTTIAIKDFLPGTNRFDFPVDSNMKELVISVTGDDLHLVITDPDKKVAPTEEITKSDSFSVIKVKKVKPGTYTAEVTSTTRNSIVVKAETSVHFEHGFSTFMPSTIADTVRRPIPGSNSYMSIKLETDKPGDVVLDVVQLLDLDDNILAQKPLHLMDKKEQFYITKSTVIPPNTLFRVAIIGHDPKTKKSITRISLTPVEPQSTVAASTENKKPTVSLVGERKIIAEYNEPLEIKCKVSGYPKPNVIWQSRDGSVLDSTLSLVELPYDYLSSISLDRVISNTTYRCIATNDLGEDSKQIEVETIRKIYFNVVKKPKGDTIQYNKEVRFECEVNANPPAVISWYKNDKKIVEDDNVKVSSNRTVLHIKHMQPYNEGHYECRAVHEYGGRRFTFSIRVSGIDAPLIDKTIKEIRAKEGSDIEIQCPVIRGTPKPTINWYYLDATEKEYSMEEDKNMERILIPHATRDARGTYGCEALNDVGSDFHIIELIFYYPPKIDGENRIKMVARVDEKVNMDCDVEGEPKPSVEWFLNDTKVVLTARHGLSYTSNNGFNFYAMENDTGVYTCMATNTFGTANKTVDLRIVRAASIQPPEESSLSANVGEYLNLPCVTDGSPEPEVQWVFHSLDPKLAPKTLSSHEMDHKLRLGRVQVKDRGFYTCIASNIGGSANISYALEVFAPPNIENVYPEKTFTGVIGDLVLRIPCKASGNPKPDITWIHGVGNIAAGTEWYDIEKDGTLVIRNLDKLSAGTYVCEARNRLSFDTESYEVVVEAYPKPGPPSKAVRLIEGNSTDLTCNIPQKLTDSVRWFKDGKQISAMKQYPIINAQISDAGLYTCRVSDQEKSRSGHIEVIVGYAPRFPYDEKEDIGFEEGLTAVMDCSAEGYPTPKVTWWHEGKQIPSVDDLYVLEDMTLSNRGQYFCLVKNEFGHIKRQFNVVSQECLLNIESELRGNQPLILNPSNTWPEFETIEGHIRISPSEIMRLSCPSGFQHIPTTEVLASCERDKFIVDGLRRKFQFSELQCREPVMPIARRTGERCLATTRYAETIKIGYEIRGKFLEVFEVCLNIGTRVPLYSKHGIHYKLANAVPKNTKWHRSAIIPYDVDEIYNCQLQTDTISSILRNPFHADDKCCFSKRQLVNPRDVSPGLPQMATFTGLNLVPQWSTCNTQNWESIERKVRELAMSTNEKLLVWTGSALQLRILGQNISIYDKSSTEQPVPKYLWKVVQDPSTKASLAIVQLNIPDLTLREAYGHQFCRDICNEVKWMNSKNWRDVTKGYTFCCNIKEFERALAYNDVFNSGDGKVLHDVYLLPDSSLVI